MNEVHRNKLEHLAQDEMMLEALKLLFLAGIEKNQPQIEKDDDNQLLGEKYRAHEEAKRVINNTLVDLAHFKTLKKPTNNYNKGI